MKKTKQQTLNVLLLWMKLKQSYHFQLREGKEKYEQALQSTLIYFLFSKLAIFLFLKFWR